MEQSVDSLNPRKRAAQGLDSLSSEEASAKRACSGASTASPHRTLLEELCDLEGEDEGPALEAPHVSSTQEDLVAEMMKSLEKVIESGERRGEEEVSTSYPSGSASPTAVSPALEFTWSNEEIGEFSESAQNVASFHEVEEYVEDFKENAQIRQLLQASDDELGLPLSSSSSDLDDNAFHEEWASLANESCTPVNGNWLDASFHQFDDVSGSEPLLLF